MKLSKVLNGALECPRSRSGSLSETLENIILSSWLRFRNDARICHERPRTIPRSDMDRHVRGVVKDVESYLNPNDLRRIVLSFFWRSFALLHISDITRTADG